MATTGCALIIDNFNLFVSLWITHPYKYFAWNKNNTMRTTKQIEIKHFFGYYKNRELIEKQILRSIWRKCHYFISERTSIWSIWWLLLFIVMCTFSSAIYEADLHVQLWVPNRLTQCGWVKTILMGYPCLFPTSSQGWSVSLL